MVTLYSIFQDFIKQTKIYIQNILPKKVSELTNDAGYLTSHQDISGKQDKLTFDTTPTANSSNPVTSGGIKTALDTKLDKTGNAVSATKLSTARTIQTNLASTTATAFDGSANITPGVTGTLSVSNGGTGATNLDNVTVGTSKKVHTTISSGTVGELVKAKMGNDDSFRIAVGGGVNAGWAEIATADDGTEPIYVRQYGDAKIDGFVTPTRTATLLDANGNTQFPGSVTAPTFSGSLNGNANTATKSTQDASGNVIADTYVRHYQNIGEKDLNDLKLGGLYANPMNVNATAGRHYPEVGHAGSIFVINNGANGDDGCTQVYTTFDSHNSYKREYDVNSKTWSAWRRYAFEDSTVANAQKLSTARKINITGNATGSTSFDGSGDVSISITVNESKHATAADTLKSTAASDGSTVARPVWLSWEGDNTKQTVSSNLTYTCSTKTLKAANFAGHLAGNADSATKANQDASGNVITDTYAKKTDVTVKGVKVDGATSPLVPDNSGIVTIPNADMSNYATISSLSSYQTKLTFDSTPTANSSNPVTSDGIKTAIDKSSSDFLDGCTTETVAALWGTVKNADTTTY